MNDSSLGADRVASLESRSQKVTDRLLELQQKHKEISDRVQNVLLETVDIALGSSPELKDYIKKNSKAAESLGINLDQDQKRKRR